MDVLGRVVAGIECEVEDGVVDGHWHVDVVASHVVEFLDGLGPCYGVDGIVEHLVACWEHLVEFGIFGLEVAILGQRVVELLGPSES